MLPLTEAEALFLAERARLIRLAYRYLGSRSDAEDVVQDAFMKFTAATDVIHPPGWLARVVTTGAIDLLRRRKSRKEDYVGQWLPEPFPDGDVPGASDRDIDISFAVMRTLEALSPAERAAFFLHDLYDQDFGTIATLLKRTPASCRKLASRARMTLRNGAPRRAATQTDLARFLAAITAASLSGDVGPLADMLSADAELISDGGGKAIAAPNVVRGAMAVARFLAGTGRKNLAFPPTVRFVSLNGGAGVLLLHGGQCETAMTIDFDFEGAVRSVYVQRNPDKLQVFSGAV